MLITFGAEDGYFQEAIGHCCDFDGQE